MNLLSGPMSFLQKSFFHGTDAQSLSLFRFLYCTALLLVALHSGPSHQLLYASPFWEPIPLFQRFQTFRIVNQQLLECALDSTEESAAAPEF